MKLGYTGSTHWDENQPKLAACWGLGETSAGSQACQRWKRAAMWVPTVLFGAKFSVFHVRVELQRWGQCDQWLTTFLKPFLWVLCTKSNPFPGPILLPCPPTPRNVQISTERHYSLAPTPCVKIKSTERKDPWFLSILGGGEGNHTVTVGAGGFGLAGFSV